MNAAKTVRESLPKAVGVLCFAACLSLYGALAFSSGAAADSGRALPGAAAEGLAALSGNAGVRQASGPAGLNILRGKPGTAVSGAHSALRTSWDGLSGTRTDRAALCAAVYAALLAALRVLFVWLRRAGRMPRPALLSLRC